jgi:hypothetical protein
MKAIPILALLAIASPAFAQGSAEKQSVPVQDQKPFLYDKLMPKRVSAPAPETVAGTTIMGQPLRPSPEPSHESSKPRGG